MIHRIAFPLLTLACFLALWFLILAVGKVPEYLLPSPVAVATYIGNNWPIMLSHAWATFAEAAVGLIVALLGAFGVAAGLSLFHSAKQIALPIIVGMQAIPIVAIAPLLALWLGIGFGSKVAMAALLCWFPMVVSAVRGFEATTLEQRSLFAIYGTTRTQLFWYLQVPQSMRFLISGARASAGLAMIGAIVAEYAGANLGLGYLITQATYRLDTVELFAAILLAAFGGLLLSWVVGLAERTALRRFLRR